jgi:hypothetical protein
MVNRFVTTGLSYQQRHLVVVHDVSVEINEDRIKEGTVRGGD